MQRSANRVSRHPFIVRGVSWIGSIGIISSSLVGTQTQHFSEASDKAVAQELPPQSEEVPAEVLFIDDTSDFDAVPEPVYVEPEAYVPEAPVATYEPEPDYYTPPEETYVEAPPAPTYVEPLATPIYEEPAAVSDYSDYEAPAVSTYEEPTYVEPYVEPSYVEPAPEPIYEAPSYVEAPAAPTYVESPESYTYTEAPEPDSAASNTAEAGINNNVYIDPTDYTLGATDTYEEPAAVVLTERSTGCETVVTAGGGMNSGCGVAAPETPAVAAQSYSAESYTLASSQPPTAQEFQPYAPPAAAPVYAPAQPATAYTPASPASSAQVVYTLASPVKAVYTPAAPTSNHAYTAPVSEYTDAAQIPMAPSIESVDVGPVSVGGDGISVTSALPPVRNYYNRNLLPAAVPGNGNTSFIFPLAIPAPITSMFGWRIHPIYGSSRFHSGTDLGAPLGTPVLATYAGEVETADFMGGYGLTVILKHRQATQETLYAHLSQVFVEPGDRVEQGAVIGRVGSTGNSTGPHLHFEFRQLTPDGWVTMDPGAQLEYALAKFVQSLQTAQSTPKPDANKS